MDDLAAALEPIVLDAWPAIEAERHDGWLLRAAEGYTSRANSIHVVGPRRLPLGDLLRYGLNWYRTRGLPLRFRLHDSGHPAELDGDLGPEFVRSPSVETLWRPIDGVDRGRMTASRNPSPVWLEAKRASGGFRPGPVGRWERITGRIESPVLFGSVEIDGSIAATGMAVVSRDWVGIFEVRVHPDRRRQGTGTELVRGLLAEATQLGATRAYLQVEETNAPALALYRGMGFTSGYHYWYRTLSDRSDVSSPP